MARQHLRTLQLDPNKVETAADFFEAYASYRLSQNPIDAIGEDSLEDVASSLRVAGQWAMFFDLPRAVSLLTRSAVIWHSLGYGFGTFMLAAIAPDQLDRSQVLSRLLQIAEQNPLSGDASRLPGEDRQTL